MGTLRTVRTPTQHPMQKNPAPAGLTGTPPIENQVTVPTSRTRLRTRRVDPAPRRKEPVERNLELKYDGQRTGPISPTAPGRLHAAGANHVKNPAILAVPHPTGKPTPTSVTPTETRTRPYKVKESGT